MLPTSFWIKRTLLIFFCSFAALCAVQALKGSTLADGVGFAALWAFIATGVFVVSRYAQARRGQHCALCKDTPQTRTPAGGA